MKTLTVCLLAAACFTAFFLAGCQNTPRHSRESTHYLRGHHHPTHAAPAIP